MDTQGRTYITENAAALGAIICPVSRAGRLWRTMTGAPAGRNNSEGAAGEFYAPRSLCGF